MSRKYVRNGGNRRSTNGQPGQWSPLYATAATPGIGGGQTVLQIFASRYGCSVNPLVPDALECYLVATVAGNVVELQASALTAEGDDGEGTLARLVFDSEIDPSFPWYLRIPAGWTAMRSRDGAPVSGLLCPSGLVATPPQGSIGISNMLDVVPPPPTPLVPMWATSVTIINSTSVLMTVTNNIGDLIVDQVPDMYIDTMHACTAAIASAPNQLTLEFAGANITIGSALTQNWPNNDGITDSVNSTLVPFSMLVA